MTIIYLEGERMRFLKSKLLISFLIIPFLVSCGVDMRDWPYVNLEFNVEEAKSVYINYVNRNDDSLSYECCSNQIEAITDVYYFLESFHISEKVTSKDVSDFNRKISIYFICDNNCIYDFRLTTIVVPLHILIITMN
jgi:hypothetical protein